MRHCGCLVSANMMEHIHAFTAWRRYTDVFLIIAMIKQYGKEKTKIRLGCPWLPYYIAVDFNIEMIYHSYKYHCCCAPF